MRFLVLSIFAALLVASSAAPRSRRESESKPAEVAEEAAQTAIPQIPPQDVKVEKVPEVKPEGEVLLEEAKKEEVKDVVKEEQPAAREGVVEEEKKIEEPQKSEVEEQPKPEVVEKKPLEEQPKEQQDQVLPQEPKEVPAVDEVKEKGITDDKVHDNIPKKAEEKPVEEAKIEEVKVEEKKPEEKPEALPVESATGAQQIEIGDSVNVEGRSHDSDDSKAHEPAKTEEKPVVSEPVVSPVQPSEHNKVDEVVVPAVEPSSSVQPSDAPKTAKPVEVTSEVPKSGE